MKRLKQTIPLSYHPPAPQTKGKKNVFVSPQDLMQAYVQMHQLEKMVQQHIPILETGIRERDQEIQKLRVLSKLKDEELQKLRTR